MCCLSNRERLLGQAVSNLARGIVFHPVHLVELKKSPATRFHERYWSLIVARFVCDMFPKSNMKTGQDK